MVVWWYGGMTYREAIDVAYKNKNKKQNKKVAEATGTGMLEFSRRDFRLGNKAR